MLPTKYTHAEVISKFVRKEYDPIAAFAAITTNSIVVSVDEQLSREAGEIRAKVKERVKVLTVDLHFKGIQEAVMI